MASLSAVQTLSTPVSISPCAMTMTTLTSLPVHKSGELEDLLVKNEVIEELPQLEEDQK